MARGKRFFAAIMVAAVVGAGVGSIPAPADAASGKVVTFIAKAIAQGLVYDAIKAIVMRDYRMSEADFRAVYAAGLAAYNRAASKPNPSLTDCVQDLFKFANPKCANTPN